MPHSAVKLAAFIALLMSHKVYFTKCLVSASLENKSCFSGGFNTCFGSMKAKHHFWVCLAANALPLLDTKCILVA